MVNIGDTRTRLKELSLIFTGPYEGRPYARSDFEKAFTADEEQVRSFVIAFGPLNHNNEWYVTVKPQENKDALLARGTMLVKGKHFRIKSADRRISQGRIHWAPIFVTNAYITSSLSFFSPEIVGMRHELSTAPGFEGVATGVRIIDFVGIRSALPTFVFRMLSGRGRVLGLSADSPRPPSTLLKVQDSRPCKEKL